MHQEGMLPISQILHMYHTTKIESYTSHMKTTFKTPNQEFHVGLVMTLHNMYYPRETNGSKSSYTHTMKAIHAQKVTMGQIH